MLFPATTSQVASHAREGEVGQTLGLQQAMGGVARMVGPIWAGALFQHLGWSAPFYVSAVLMAVAAAISIFLVVDDGVGRRVVSAEQNA
jgi:MFS family permease